MIWEQSYSASWRIIRVNRDTWADAEQVTNVVSANVTRTADGSLLETGEFEVTGDFQPDYYRIVMTAVQGGDIERVDVATLLFDFASGGFDYGRQAQTLSGYSVLFPASKTALISGEYAPAGTDGARYAARLLERTINAPVSVEGSFTLNEHIVHKIGASVLEAVWDVLNAGSYILRIDGRGVVHIMPKPTDPDLVVDNSSAGLLLNGITYTTNIAEIPNRYIVIDENVKTIAENSDPESVVSSVSRGYYIDEVDESPKPVDGETMAAYATRRLHELSYMTDEREYTREYSPNVMLYSIIRASINGLEGDLRVQSQTLTCNQGITVDETADREVNLWES